MTQAAAHLEAANPALGRAYRTTTTYSLFEKAWERLVRAYRISRQRDELARSMSMGEIGRETGVRC